jgi:SAM-dependent methyltransferase
MTEEPDYLPDLRALEEMAATIPDTRMMAVGKVTALAVMNMRWERVMLDDSFDEHPYPVAKQLIADARGQMAAWSEARFIEGEDAPVVRPSDEMEERHHDLFQDLWVNFSEDDYNDRIALYVDRLRINDLDSDFVRGKRVIDFGCGHGNFLHAFLAEGAGAGIGIDYGEESIRYAAAARDRLGVAADKLDFRVASVYESGEADESFDIAVQNGVFHHLDDEDAAYRELHRVLKTGGWAWFYTDGAGGVSYDLWDASVRMLLGVPHQTVTEVLDFLGVETNKRYHLGDGLNAVYRHTTYEAFLERLGSYGFGNFRRLQGGAAYDLDGPRLEAPYAREKLGSGDIRVLAQKL